MFVPISNCHCTRNTSKPQKFPIRSKRPTLMGHSDKSSFRDWDNSIGERLQFHWRETETIPSDKSGRWGDDMVWWEFFIFSLNLLSLLCFFFFLIYIYIYIFFFFFCLNLFSLTFVWWISYKSLLILSFNEILFHKSEACVISSSTIWRNA